MTQPLWALPPLRATGGVALADLATRLAQMAGGVCSTSGPRSLPTSRSRIRPSMSWAASCSGSGGSLRRPKPASR
jgi:hypothetical protein